MSFKSTTVESGICVGLKDVVLLDAVIAGLTRLKESLKLYANADIPAEIKTKNTKIFELKEQELALQEALYKNLNEYNEECENLIRECRDAISSCRVNDLSEKIKTTII